MVTIRTLTRRLGAAALAAPLLFGVVACNDEDDTAVEDAEERGTGELLIGETINIEGEVEEVLSPTAFTMGADETLVYGTTAFGVDEDDEVVVTGTVTEFIIADIERDLDFDFDDDLYIDFENEFAVEASSVAIVEEG